ncbi:MAG: SoxR reducing system RseC family protein [Bacteroidetes bacterium]|nr:SoxR reducing system RseC family protein [Bacteroidota bacterium]MBS1976263.1 SoxR reducing system RseC family protein [Bacteroidota bacterium]
MGIFIARSWYMIPDAKRHLGTISARKDDKWKVTLADPDGCKVCHRGLCWDTADPKSIEVQASSASFQIGQKVWVEIDDRTGQKAILLFYGLPSLIIVASLVISLTLGIPELWAGMLSLGLLAPYYIGLRLTRRHWSGQIQLELCAYE